MNSSGKTVFLDRDGVLNRRLIDDYVTCLDELQILEAVPEALARLTRMGFRLVVVTNQRGVAINRMTLEDVARVHRFLSQQVGLAGGLLAEFFVCPHDRDEGCNCRKPQPGLLDQAHAAHPVNWSKSWLIGDSDSDIQAGRARAVRTIKVAGPGKIPADFQARDLAAAVKLIQEQEKYHE